MTQSSPIKTDNPLLNLGFEIPFDRIKPEHAEPAVDILIAKCREDLERAAQAPKRQFAGFLQELDTLGQQLAAVQTVVGHLNGVISSDEWRAANEAILPKVSAFFTELGLHPGLWAAMKAYQQGADAQQLSSEWTRFLTLEVDAFRRNGADLGDAGKQRLTEINVSLAEITNQYGKNVMDGIKAYELYVGPERMAGVPQRLKDATAADAEAHGKAGMHRLTLHTPVYGPVITYADDRSLREELMRANNLVGVGEGRDNRELLPQILRLRRERAALLGFENFADLVTADRMSGSAQAAIQFEHDLEGRTRPFFDEENRELLAYYRQKAGEDAPEMAAWDASYWAEKLRQERYDFDAEVLRPYFPMEQVLSGMFEITRRVFGITVKEAQAAGWHEEVKYYDIFNEAGEHIASFYTDWFPRDSKRGGAWMNALYTGGPREDGFAPHLGLMCGNLNPPSGDTPSLLSLGEVETVFHEFGHLLHHALARVPVQSLSGTKVAWDFVELPSQIMENWVWTPEGLELIAKHYQTGEGLPDALYQKMLAARNFRAGGMAMRQYSFATVDLALHVEYDEAQGDPLDFARTLMNRYTFLPLPESNFITQFGHLFSSPVGYAGGYYSYKWAEVLDADAFSRFENEGVFNRQTGREYVDKLLSRGGSVEPAQLYRDFMGRDPDPEALLRRSGLSKQ
ncbi:M3 family metallopeptidase [Deinococcus detaillensis]|uniref:oligopeptidase A n=1 Tax=Deinococcus detaillensis TaxID=2592048 RepID=A0A553UWQ9_9DEIO|nr:M3 family metallopeptidase [Deinococcus detaillensis]TSA84640.1 M3 family metallopeptidase [Deinococcus detaillensis]